MRTRRRARKRDHPFDPSAQRLADAAELDPERHAPMAMATRRQLGGTSVVAGAAVRAV
jgi:hypothetical protein